MSTHDNRVILMAPEAHHVVLNKVFEAAGRGPETFFRKASPSGENPPTVRWCNFTNMQPESESIVRALRHTLPELPFDNDLGEPGAWGVGYWPTEEDALAAIASFALYVCDDPEKTQDDNVADILGNWNVVEIEDEIEL